MPSGIVRRFMFVIKPTSHVCKNMGAPATCFPCPFKDRPVQSAAALLYVIASLKSCHLKFACTHLPMPPWYVLIWKATTCCHAVNEPTASLLCMLSQQQAVEPIQAYPVCIALTPCWHHEPPLLSHFLATDACMSPQHNQQCQICASMLPLAF